MDATTPSADEGIVHRAANGGAGEGNHAADPLFGAFFADTNGEAAGEFRSEFFDDLLFGEILAEINAGGGRGGEPEFDAFVVALLFETVEKAKPLDEAQGEDGEKARVREQGEHATQAEAGALGESDALGVVNQAFGDGVEFFDGDIAHAAEVGNPEAVLVGEIFAEVVGVNFDGTHAAKHTKTEEPAKGPTGERLW